MIGAPTVVRVGAKCYGQGCSLALALDVVGERWTLLIVRELLLGPKRYSDLAARLAGIPTNLLGDRLKQLDAAGLVARRRTPPPTPAVLYELTAGGRSLTPVVLALMEFGTDLPAQEGLRACGAWVALRLLRAEPPDRGPAAPDRVLALELDVPVTVRVSGRHVDVADGTAERPDATVTTDPFTFHALVTGGLDLDTAVGDGRLGQTGDPTLLRDLLAALPGAAHPADR